MKMSKDEHNDKVSLTVDGDAVQGRAGTHLLNVLLSAGKAVDTSCGGRGTCHLCRVVIAGAAERLPGPNRIERRALGNVLLARGMRLACQVPALDALQVELLPYESAAQRRERLQRAKAQKGRP